MHADIPTLFLVIIAAGAMLASAIAFVSWGRDRNLLLWASALALHTFGYVLFSLRGQINDFASIVLGNVALSVTFALFSESTYRFQMRRVSRWLVWSPVAIVAIGFYLLQTDLTARVVLGGCVFAAQSLLLLTLMLQQRRETIGRGQYLIQAGATLALLVFGLRALAVATGNVEMLNLTASNPIQTGTFLMSVMSLMLLALGLVVMTAERSEDSAHKGQLFIQGVLDSVSNQIAVIDEDGTIVAINQAWQQFSMDNSEQPGQPALNTAVGTNYLKICSPSVGEIAPDARSANDGISAVLSGRLPIFSLEYPCHSPQELRWFTMTATPLGNGGKGAVVVHQNITQRVLAEQKLLSSEVHFRMLTEGVADVVWKLDLKLRFTYISPADERMRGYRSEEVLGRHVLELFTEEGVASIRQQLSLRELAEQSSGSSMDSVTFEAQQHCKDGSLVWTEIISTRERDASGIIIGHHGITRNISERRRAQEQVHQLAFFDALTQLANRRLFNDRLSQALVRSKREQLRLGLLFIDLDKFKPVNDEHGHAMGDWLLQSVAQRIESCLRASDTAARVGGEEFVVLLPSMQSTSDAIAVGEKIRHALELPLTTSSNLVLSATASIGVATYPDHGQTEEALLRIGDAAMYQAKKAGGNRVEMGTIGDQPGDPDAIESAGQSIVQLTWKLAFASGHATIDNEHRELFRLANTLLDKAATVGIEPMLLHAAFDALLDHVVKHFATEESILAEKNYPKLAQHAQAHRDLVAQALGLRHQFDTGGVSLGELVAFLANDVVARHMLQEDRKFFSMLSDPLTALQNTL